jgi:uncharacterized protein YebE (UPF0316 family)
MEVFMTCLLIVVARVADVSLGTVRTVAVVNGRRGLAVTIGFFEVLIWVVVVRAVVQSLDRPIYAVAYASGFALGTWVGVTIESRLGTGNQVLRVFTRIGGPLADELRHQGFVVTVFEGSGREGPISMLFLETSRRGIRRVLDLVTGADPDCFYIVDDVRLSSGRRGRFQRATGWRAIGKRK